MKLLYCHNEGDYDALSFEQQYDGLEVSDIIKRVEIGEKFKNKELEEEEGEDDNFRLSVKEFGDVDPKFIDWIRSEIHDYDDSKHYNFYLEGEKLSR